MWPIISQENPSNKQNRSYSIHTDDMVERKYPLLNITVLNTMASIFQPIYNVSLLLNCCVELGNDQWLRFPQGDNYLHREIQQRADHVHFHVRLHTCIIHKLIFLFRFYVGVYSHWNIKSLVRRLFGQWILFHLFHPPVFWIRLTLCFSLLSSLLSAPLMLSQGQ